VAITFPVSIPDDLIRIVVVRRVSGCILIRVYCLRFVRVCSSLDTLFMSLSLRFVVLLVSFIHLCLVFAACMLLVVS